MAGLFTFALLESRLDGKRGRRFSPIMKLRVVACSIAVVSSLHAEAPTGPQLLDDVVSHPGSYSQVCDMMTSPSDIPYRAYQIKDYDGVSFSDENQAKIDKNREPLIQAIRARLLEIDFARDAKTPAPDPTSPKDAMADAYGCDPRALSPLILGLVQQLHAIEALPELLVVEKKLVASIARAKDNADAKPPVVSGWFLGEIYPEGYEVTSDEVKRDRHHALFQARAAQRDLVMLMAILMREKSYAPALKTSLETEYVKGLKVMGKKYHFPQIKKGEPVPQEVDGMKVELDVPSGLLKPVYDAVRIPYTRESRDEVRAAAEKWIQEHP